MCNATNYIAMRWHTRKTIALRIDDELLDNCRKYGNATAFRCLEQIRGAICPWFETKGVIKSERKRAATRKRSRTVNSGSESAIYR